MPSLKRVVQLMNIDGLTRENVARVLVGFGFPAPISQQPEDVFQPELEEQFYEEEKKRIPGIGGILCSSVTRNSASQA
uniref:Uncharacterized protein n=1 Tax=Salix viminalis TaxID=40686 RepID=A0A6N2N290_SALVM